MNESSQAQKQVEQAGTFRAYPISWTVEPSKDTQSVAIAFQFAIHQQWAEDPNSENGGDWTGIWPVGYYTYNRTYVIKKDGQINAGAVEALVKSGLWNGDFDAIGGPVAQVFVLIDVEANTYNNKVSYRAEWISADAPVPSKRGGGFKVADPELLKSLRTRFNGAVKAIVGGSPKTPPGTPPRVQPAAAPATVAPAAAARPPSVKPPAVRPPAAAAAEPTEAQADGELDAPF